MLRRRKRRKLWPPPPLTEGQILGWADAFRELKGVWPRKDSSAVPGAWNERWSAINAALQKGLRGLPGGSSLPKLLAEHRGVPNRKASMTDRMSAGTSGAGGRRAGRKG
jgi:hypothetical protein